MCVLRCSQIWFDGTSHNAPYYRSLAKSLRHRPKRNPISYVSSSCSPFSARLVTRTRTINRVLHFCGRRVQCAPRGLAKENSELSGCVIIISFNVNGIRRESKSRVLFSKSHSSWAELEFSAQGWSRGTDRTDTRRYSVCCRSTKSDLLGTRRAGQRF